MHHRNQLPPAQRIHSRGRNLENLQPVRRISSRYRKLRTAQNAQPALSETTPAPKQSFKIRNPVPLIKDFLVHPSDRPDDPPCPGRGALGMSSQWAKPGSRDLPGGLNRDPGSMPRSLCPCCPIQAPTDSAAPLAAVPSAGPGAAPRDPRPVPVHPNRRGILDSA